MARVTVEDCVVFVPNRFELCLITSNRAKSILSGAATSFDRKEKPAVIALREVADKTVNVDNIRQNIIRSIKNRGIEDYGALIESNNASDSGNIVEEIEKQDIILTDNLFVEDEIEVND